MCCSQPQVFRHPATGQTVCLAHSHLWRCTDCDRSVEQCQLVGCGAWVCDDPLIRVMLEQDYTNPSPHIH